MAVADSTQALAHAAAAAGAGHGTVFVADWQRAGRGRRGRVWTAPPGSSLLFTVLARDVALPPFAQTAVTTLAICRVLERSGLRPRIKWPNDVMLGDRKLAGVLAERVSRSLASYQLLGVGLNVHDGAAIDPLPPTATTLERESAARFARGSLLAALLHELAPLLHRPAAAWEAEIYGDWLARLWRRRQRVRLAADQDVLDGVIEGVAVDGALLIRPPGGALQRIAVGDLQL
jgi:BirA family biotin operon repressor/biotin-[acetyl-CoA-carboxylase] ligase